MYTNLTTSFVTMISLVYSSSEYPRLILDTRYGIQDDSPYIIATKFMIGMICYMYQHSRVYLACVHHLPAQITSQHPITDHHWQDLIV